MISKWTLAGIAAIAFFAIVFSAQILIAEPKKTPAVDSIHVLKISSEDGTAVIKTSDGKMQVVHAGDVLLIENNTVRNKGKKSDVQQGAAHAEKCNEVKITEIAEGRVVIEEKTDKGTDTVIISLRDGKQKIQRITKFINEKKVLKVPKTEIVNGENNN